MENPKTDNQLLQELLVQATETRKSIDKIKGNTFFIVIVIAVSLVLSGVMYSQAMEQ